MKDTKRSLRRFHQERMKNKARKLYPYDSSGKLANNLTACSCEMCGNPRKHFGEKTIQERKHDQW